MSPRSTAQGQTLDDEKIEVMGLSLAPKSARPALNTHLDIDVFFHVKERTNHAYRFLLAAWPVTLPAWKPTDPAPQNLMQRSAMRPTADGFFPSDRWRTGEYIRDRFSLQIPAIGLTVSALLGLGWAQAFRRYE